MTNKVRKKIENLKNEMGFQQEIKIFFIPFKRLSLKQIETTFSEDESDFKQ